MKKINQANLAFAVYSIITSALFVVLIWSLCHQLKDISWIPNVTHILINFWHDFRFRHSIGESLLTVVFLYTFITLLFVVIKDMYKHYKWNDFIKHQTEKALTIQLNHKYSEVGFPILVVVDKEPFALTSGILKQRIVISTRLIESLSEDETKAVLAHEAYHCLNAHPSKKWVLRRLAQVMRYFPILKGLSLYYSIWIELLADRYAIELLRNKTYLASAIVKMINHSECRRTRNLVVTADFANTAINYRLKQILDLQENLHVVYFSKRAFWSSIVVGVVFTSIVIYSCI